MPETILPQPDWVQATRLFDGLGELIACLSPAKRFDTRGTVFFIDDFEDGLSKGTFTYDGVDASYDLSSRLSRFGGFSLKLTGGSNGGRYSQCAWYSHKSIYSKMGMELRFQLGTGVEYVRLSLLILDGITEHRGSVQYDPVNMKWQYLNSLGSYVDLIDEIILDEGEVFFHPAKLVVDFVHDKYQRLVLGDQDVDMSALSLYTSGSITNPRHEVTVAVFSIDGSNGSIYVDSVILTKNEPS